MGHQIISRKVCVDNLIRSRLRYKVFIYGASNSERDLGIKYGLGCINSLWPNKKWPLVA
jgi:hypothetical protein